MNENINRLREDIRRLKTELAELEAALPAHSVRPEQLMAIESLEDEISRKQVELNTLKIARGKTSSEDDSD